MTRTISRFSLFALSAAILMGPIQTSTAAPSADPILRMTFVGVGQASHDVRDVPLVIVTSNGRLFQAGPISSFYPKPSLDSFTSAVLSSKDQATVTKLAEAAKLNRPLDLGTPPTADVSSLVITYKGKRNVIASFGVGEGEMPKAQLDGRKKISALINFLQTRPNATVGVPSSVVVMPVNADGRLPADPNLKQAPRPWPTAAFDLREMGGCKVLVGTEAAAAVAALVNSNELTPWTSSGYTYLVFARPALPGDRGCGN
jgi:hypothetical protein